MAERDRAAIDVDLVDIPAEILVDRASLRGKGLVGLDQVEIVDATSRPSSAPCGSPGSGPVPMIAGSTPAVAQETMRASGFSPRFSASAAVISTTAAAPSLMPEALPAVTVPFLSKAGRSFASTSTVVPCLRMLVGVDDGLAAPGRDLDRRRSRP